MHKLPTLLLVIFLGSHLTPSLAQKRKKIFRDIERLEWKDESGQLVGKYEKIENGYNYGKANFLQFNEFDTVANFSNSIFDVANFYGSKFNNTVLFRVAEIDTIIFLGTECHGDAVFYNTKFGMTSIFNYAIFKKEAYFDECVFDSLLYFTGVKFEDNVSFQNFTLPSILNMEEVKSVKTIDLTKSSKPIRGSFCNIYLKNADLEKIRIDYIKFRLAFDSLDHKNFELKQSIYERLLKNFERDGQKLSYKNLDVEYKNELYHHNMSNANNNFGTAFWWSVGLLDAYWWNYGYNKEYIFIWSIGLLLLFSLVNALIGFNNLNKNVYCIEGIFDQSRNSNRGSVKAWLNKQVLTIYYTGMIFFGLKMSFEKINYGNLGIVSFLFFQYLIGLLCVAYLFNFVISN